MHSQRATCVWCRCWHKSEPVKHGPMCMIFEGLAAAGLCRMQGPESQDRTTAGEDKAGWGSCECFAGSAGNQRRHSSGGGSGDGGGQGYAAMAIGGC